MKRHSTVRLSITALLLICPWSVKESRAAVPDRIAYQGRLLSGTNLVNGSVELSLRLYDAASGGTLLYEDSNTVSVVDGLYATFLGDDTTFGTLTGALTNGNVYLEVAVAGAPLAPRERIASVAYALLTAGLPDGAVTTAMLADDAVTGTKIADGTISNADLAADSVTSTTIADGTLTGADFVDGSISNANLAADSVTSDTVMDETLTGTDIADGSISNADLAAGSVISDTVADESLTGTDIADGSISNADLAADSVTADTVADGALTGTDIADGSISNADLAADSVTAGTVADGALTGTDIADGSISNADLAVDSVTSGTVADGSLTGTDIADGSISNADLAAGSVNSDTVADGSLTGTEIADGSISNADLAVDSVTSGTVADGSLTGTDIADGSISNADLAAGSVTSGTIADGTLTGIDIADSSISNADLAVDSVTSDTVADGSLTGTDIADGSISNADLAAGSVTSATVADGSLTGTDIADGTISNADIAPNTFWTTVGNTGTAPTVDFLGTSDDVPLDLRVNGERALRLAPNAMSPNVVAGHEANTISVAAAGAVIGGGGSAANPNMEATDFAVIGGGAGNVIETTAVYAVIAGGSANSIREAAEHGFIGSGDGNEISTSAIYVVIGGGQENLVGEYSHYNVIGGGSQNTEIGTYGVVGGGELNVAAGYASAVGGGSQNQALSDSAGVAAGYNNTASGDESTVGGGRDNAASGLDATVPGGQRNVAGGHHSFAAGRRAKATNDGTFVWADAANADFGSTTSNQFLIRATGGVGIGTNATPEMLTVAGSALVAGSITAAALAGDGAGVSNVDAITLQGSVPADFAATSHTHSGTDITSGTVAEARIDSAIARDTEIMPTVLANDGSGSTLDADLFDGRDSSLFATNGHLHDASAIASGTIDDARLSTNVALLNSAGTISADWDNTANPWADNEVSDTLTVGPGGSVADGALSANVSLLGSSIDSSEIADGTVAAVDVDAASFSNTFWKVDGNAGTTAGTHFLGTTDGEPLEIRAAGVGIGTNVAPEMLTVAGNIAPSRNGQFDLGSPALRWTNLYLASHIDHAGTLQFVSGTTTTLTISTAGNVDAASFAGDGSSLTSVDADTLDGNDSSAFAAASHTHSGDDITSGTIAESWIDSAVARDAEIMPTVLANDGTGSTLDADLFDGRDSSLFSTNGHSHDASDIVSGTIDDARISSTITRDSEIMPTVLANDGAGSTLDADLLDGRDSSLFSTNGHTHDASDIVSGTIDDARLSANVARLNAAGTISADWDNTANPWADDEVSDTLTVGPGGSVADGALSASVSLLGSSIDSSEIADGTVAAIDVDAASFSNTFWKADGNAGTSPGTHFLGTTDNQPIELRANNLRSLRIEPAPGGAPNMIGGSLLNSVAGGVVGAVIAGGGATNYMGAILTNRVAADFGSIGGGYGNLIESDAHYSTISGGRQNSIQSSAEDATIGGGTSHTIGDAYATTIAGGEGNTIHDSGFYGTIGGGYLNEVGNGAQYGTVAGGQENVVDGQRGAIGGGELNAIESGATHATVAGGHGNIVSNGAQNASIGGGEENEIGDGAYYATVPGGYQCAAGGPYSFAVGRQAKARHGGAFVWADSSGFDFESTAEDEFSVRCVGGARFVSGIDGGGAVTSGVLLAAGDGGWTDLSDRNAKENIVPVDPGEILQKVASLPIATWNYKTQNESIRHIGPMAQDFHAAFHVGATDRGIGTVDANGVSLAAIQALESENRILKAQIRALMDRVRIVEESIKR